MPVNSLNIIFFFASFTILIPIVIGFIRFKSLFKPLRQVLYYLVFTLFFDAFISYLSINEIKNDWLVQFYAPIQFFVFAETLRKFINGEDARKIIFYLTRGLLAVWGVFILYFLTTKGFAGDWEGFKNALGTSEALTFTIEGVALIAFAIMLLFDMYHIFEPVPLSDNRKFWFAVAILIYFSGNLILYSSINKVVSVSPITAQKLYMIHAFFNVAGYFLLAKAFLCRR
jgi:hypothetical protein